MSSLTLADLCKGLPLDPLPPPQTVRDLSVSHAPPRTPSLNKEEKKVLTNSVIISLAVCLTYSYGPQLALKNALRYFPPSLHSTLASEFAHELVEYGHIYMYRFRPHFDIK